MSSGRVLICGAGVAGSIVAFWLAKHDFDVVVVERSRANQKLGQGIEIEEPALKVVKLMGILDELEARRTGEMGFKLEDEQARLYATFDVGRFSPTGALELMRGDLTEVLYKAADAFPNVTYQFETTIQSLNQTSDKVTVELENRNEKTIKVEEFDLVVGADGVNSRTRRLVMGSPEELDCFKSIGTSVAYFSIPSEERDWPYSRLCNFTNRRVLWLRPVGKDAKMTSAYFMHVHGDRSSLRRVNAVGDRQKQKEALAELYSGLGWEIPRAIEAMMQTENFYFDELAQVKLSKWSQQRVVLVGDAAWAPTPFTGEGNQLAIIGAWVLAQELSRDRGPEAFEKYEKRLRSYVESCQNIPLGGYAPYFFIPKTVWGIGLMRTIFRFTSWVVRIGSRMNLGRFLPEEQPHAHFDLEVEEENVEVAR